MNNEVSKGRLYSHCSTCNEKLRVKTSNPYCSQKCKIRNFDERTKQKVTLEKWQK